VPAAQRWQGCSLHPPTLQSLERLRWAQMPAACGHTSPWALPVKEAESGFVFAMKALSFSSIPVQLAFW